MQIYFRTSQTTQKIKHKVYKQHLRSKCTMLIPISCFSCGKPIAHLYEKYKERVSKGESPDKVLTELGLERYCCRAMFLGQVDLIEEISKFKKF